MTIEALNRKSICILGYGREGKAMTEALETHAPDAIITIADRNSECSIEHEKHNIQLGENWLHNLEDFDVIIKSPGIPPNTLGNETHDYTNSTQIFLDTVQAKGSTVIGVTGTKGKSTTASLIYEILKAAGKDVHLVGNIGIPAISYIDKASTNTIFVQEMSSYQLADLTSGPQIALITSFFPEHLDYHGSIERYRDAKRNICLSASHIYHANNDAAQIVEGLSAPITIYSETDSPVAIDATHLKGAHNTLNYAGAFLLTTQQCNVDSTIAIEAIKSYKGLPHRLQSLGMHHGCEWISDTISTTPESTIAAIEALGKHLHTIILGGKDRGLDFTELGKVIDNSAIEHVILFGENSEKIGNTIQTKKKSSATTMTEVINLTISNLTCHPEPDEGPYSLLSPASPSYDMYKDFEEKGDVFAKAILAQP